MNQQSRDSATDARLLGALVAFLLAMRMYTGALWIMVPTSITGRIAAASAYPEIISYTWMVLAICVAPYTISQVFNCWKKYNVQIIYFTCRVIIAGGCIWGYLAFETRNFDFQYVTVIFILDTLACIAMAAVLANSRNNQQALWDKGEI